MGPAPRPPPPAAQADTTPQARPARSRRGDLTSVVAWHTFPTCPGRLPSPSGCVPGPGGELGTAPLSHPAAERSCDLPKGTHTASRFARDVTGLRPGHTSLTTRPPSSVWWPPEAGEIYPAGPRHPSLLHTYCVHREAASRPRGCRPALAGGPVLDGVRRLCARGRREEASLLWAVRPELPRCPFHHGRRTRACLSASVKRRLSPHTPIRERKTTGKPDRSREAFASGIEEVIANQDGSNRTEPAGPGGPGAASTPPARGGGEQGRETAPPSPRPFTLAGKGN